MTNLDNFLGGFTKILQEKWQVDIQLKAGKSVDAAPISAHKLVLAARSNVFKTMFESDEFKGNDEVETVTISDMNQEELEAFVDFIYSSGGSLSEKHKKHVDSLGFAAYKYEIPYLLDLCIEESILSMKAWDAQDIDELTISQILTYFD